MKKTCLFVGFVASAFVVVATPCLEFSASGVALGEDAAQMSRWSKRNVVPSKIALGLVFTILGILLLPLPFAHLGGLFK